MGALLTSKTQILPYDHPGISARCLPRSGKSNEGVHLEPNARIIQVCTPSGFKLECVWVEFEAMKLTRNDHPQKILLHFHGNGELAWQTAAMWAEDFHQALGVRACFFAEYRGYGASTGVACLCDMQNDFEAILDAVLAASGMEAKAKSSLLVYGRSIGSIFALAFAARFPDAASGLILESGIANIPEWVLWYISRTDHMNEDFRMSAGETFFTSKNIDKEEAWYCAEKYLNTCRRLKEQYLGPLLILHTAADRVVVSEHAETFHRFASATPQRSVNKLVIWDKGGHNDIHDKNIDEYLKELRDFAESTNNASASSCAEVANARADDSKRGGPSGQTGGPTTLQDE